MPCAATPACPACPTRARSSCGTHWRGASRWCPSRPLLPASRRWRSPGRTIFYEAPHKLRTTLDDLTAAFGADRSITLCRELTKLHEEIWKTTLGEAVEHYRAAEPRGEYVLVMAGAPAGAAEEEELTLEQAAQRAFALTIEGFSASAAAKTAAQGTAYSKSEVYKQLLLLQQATE